VTVHRPTAARFARAAATLLVALLAGEGLARLLHAPQPVRRVFDPFAWRILAPDLDDSFINARGDVQRVRLNELGLRGPRLDAPVAPGTLTLLFLGGSAVENYPWPDEATFPALAGDAVARRLGRPVRVFNGGVSGAVSGTSLARLQHQGLDLRPSLVVVMDGLNDLLGGFHPRFRRDGRHLSRPPEIGLLPRSFLFDWLRTLRPQACPPRRAAREQRQFDYADFAARDVFARNQRSLAAIAEAHGVPILFLTQPTTYSDAPTADDLRRYYLTESLIDLGVAPPDVPSLAAGMRAFNATTSSLPQSPDVHVFDLAARLPRTYDLFIDECHFTETGNRRVAEELIAPIAAALRSDRNGAAASDGTLTKEAEHVEQR
jgi:lysophospholipase L1-like esterase